LRSVQLCDRPSCFILENLQYFDQYSLPAPNLYNINYTGYYNPIRYHFPGSKAG
jgi:hypothetical protein